MEITLDTIIAIASLFLGGGGGAFFTWRYQRSKAKAEAEQAETTAAKEMQDVYQQLIDDVKKDRADQRAYIDELKDDRNALREERNKMQKRLGQLSDEIDDLKRVQARQGRQIEAMRPFLCADLKCPHRAIMQWSDLSNTTLPSPGKDGEDNSHDMLCILRLILQ